jgi:heme-degrading monooxygenase HmoA
MSVVMGMRLAVDPGRFEEVVNANRDRMVAVADRGKQAGAIHHCFYANEAGDEILILDEWPDAETFKKFFDGAADIGELMQAAGVTERPTPEFWRELDTPDKF